MLYTDMHTYAMELLLLLIARKQIYTHSYAREYNKRFYLLLKRSESREAKKKLCCVLTSSVEVAAESVKSAATVCVPMNVSSSYSTQNLSYNISPSFSFSRLCFLFTSNVFESNARALSLFAHIIIEPAVCTQ